MKTKKIFCLLSSFFFVIAIGFSISLQGFCATSSEVYDFLPSDSSSNIVSIFTSSTSAVYPNNITYEPWKPRTVVNFTSPGVTVGGIEVSYYVGKNSIPAFPKLDINKTYHLTVKYGVLHDEFKIDSSSVLLFINHNKNNGVSPSSIIYENGIPFYLFDIYVSPEIYRNIDVLSFYCFFPLNSITAYIGIYNAHLEVKSKNQDVIDQFGSNYSKPNTTEQDKYDKAESAAFGKIESGLGGTISQWNNLGGTLASYQGAFMGFNSFFNKLTSITWIRVILIISVSVGIFALLLGAVNLIIKHGGGD